MYSLITASYSLFSFACGWMNFIANSCLEFKHAWECMIQIVREVPTFRILRRHSNGSLHPWLWDSDGPQVFLVHPSKGSIPAVSNQHLEISLPLLSLTLLSSLPCRAFPANHTLPMRAFLQLKVPSPPPLVLGKAVRSLQLTASFQNTGVETRCGSLDFLDISL